MLRIYVIEKPEVPPQEHETSYLRNAKVDLAQIPALPNRREELNLEAMKPFQTI